MEMKLTCELVPQTAWYSNVRSNVSKEEWDKIRKKSYSESNNLCAICSDSGKNQGYNHAVECHEIFEYDDVNHVQKLTQLISLCPRCHKCKHPGLAQINGETNIVIAQIMKVNEMTKKQAEKYLEECFKTWKERSKHNWTLDIKFLDEYINNKKKDFFCWNHANRKCDSLCTSSPYCYEI